MVQHLRGSLSKACFWKETVAEGVQCSDKLVKVAQKWSCVVLGLPRQVKAAVVLQCCLFPQRAQAVAAHLSVFYSHPAAAGSSPRGFPLGQVLEGPSPFWACPVPAWQHSFVLGAGAGGLFTPPCRVSGCSQGRAAPPALGP